MRCSTWGDLNKCFFCGRKLIRTEGKFLPVCDYKPGNVPQAIEILEQKAMKLSRAIKQTVT